MFCAPAELILYPTSASPALPRSRPPGLGAAGDQIKEAAN